jgi:hypothetical protein
MQAVGMVNDHAVNCFRYSQVALAAAKPQRLPGKRKS